MARKEKNIHYLYKTTCIITGRWYIGMHSTCKLEDEYMGSGTRLRRSIRKYGVDKHIKEILEFFENRKQLIDREIEVVNKELLSKQKCMNLVLGGQGGFLSLEGAKKGRKVTNERYKDKLRGWSSKGGTTTFERYGNNLAKYTYDWNGKKHSNETKKLMSNIRKGTGIGKTNSQFGTCWITKDGTNAKIKKEDLEAYLKKDWIKGRKISFSPFKN